ncbi:MAG: hypothetical protein M3Z06_03945, partial [Actinomycetota bacterium]|nr:hypothetical protein [Actinomycetota bacterium]
EPVPDEPVPDEPVPDEPVPDGPASEPAAPRPAPSPAAAVVVEPERFSAALTRLREAVPAEAGPPDPAPRPAASPREPPPRGPAAWLPDVFRQLAREDPATAGQLVLELLPAQGTVHPQPIAYDLELPGQTCIQLTLDADALKLELGRRRPPSEVRFAVTGDPASLARMLAVGRLGRRLRRGLPKVTGDRHGLEALDALVRAPLSLRQLHDAGVRLEPRLALEVVARMIDPRWTSESRFAIGYRPPDNEPVVYLEVGDGESAKVSDVVAPDLVAGVIAGEPDSLLARLDAGEPDALEFDGERAQLAKVMSWVKRAQSG